MEVVYETGILKQVSQHINKAVLCNRKIDHIILDSSESAKFVDAATEVPSMYPMYCITKDNEAIYGGVRIVLTYS